MHLSMASNFAGVPEEDGCWPAFPVSLQEGVGAQVSGVLYAGLGTAGNAWYRLDASSDQKTWTSLASFPDDPIKGAVSVVAGGKIYVFGGIAYNKDLDCMQQLTSSYCYDPTLDLWQKLPVDLPVGLLGVSAVCVEDRKVLFFGGYNRQQFDQYSMEFATAKPEQRAELACTYMSRPIAEFCWNDQVWQFDLNEMSWSTLGQVQHEPNCGSGLCVLGKDIYLISGEVKPGFRSSLVKLAHWDEGRLTWKGESTLPSVNGSDQEGIAGSFAGRWGDFLICAGGTNFPGSMQRYAQGQFYAHKGLEKTWRDEVYVLRDGEWLMLGRLPLGRAYGLSFQVAEGILLVGGDIQNGIPCTESLFLPHRFATTLSQMKTYLEGLCHVN
jgi:N-acetylneuraminate epimerase